MHSHNWLMFRWRLFSQWGSDRIIYSFAREGYRYIGYGLQRPRYFPIPAVTRLQIIDAPLMLIFRMGQGACCCYIWPNRQPLPRLWMAVTNRHLGYPSCTAKNSWCSVDAHFHNGAVTVLFTLLPRKAASRMVMGSTNQVTFQLLNLEDYKSVTPRWCSLYSTVQRRSSAINNCIHDDLNLVVAFQHDQNLALWRSRAL